MASPVTTSPQALKSYIQEYGPVDEERAKEIVIEHGCPENKARFALLYPLGRKWLKKEAGVYYLNDVAPASRNGAKADGDALPPADFQTQETEGLAPPESTLAAAAVRVGISDRVARITASYLSDTADIFDPDQLWRGLGNCTELSPSERRRLFESWVSSQGLRPS